jgi:hypothetical protein
VERADTPWYSKSLIIGYSPQAENNVMADLAGRLN